MPQRMIETSARAARPSGREPSSCARSAAAATVIPRVATRQSVSAESRFAAVSNDLAFLVIFSSIMLVIASMTVKRTL